MECVLHLRLEQFRFGQTIFGADSDFLPSDHAFVYRIWGGETKFNISGDCSVKEEDRGRAGLGFLPHFPPFTVTDHRRLAADV